MPMSLADIYMLLPAFLLVLFRVSGLMLATPLFSSPILPTQLKVLLAVAMSLAVFPLMYTHVQVPVTMATAIVGLIGELAVGLMIGFAVSLVFLGVQVAGQLVSQQAGLAMGDIFNPLFDSSSTVVSELYFFVAMVVFLGVGGDQALIRSLLDSFAFLPPLAFQVTPRVTEMLVDLITLSFVLAIRLGGPTMLALLIAFLTLGFISRTLPQMNLMTVGFPVKLALALVVMAMTMMGLEPVLIDGLNVCMDAIHESLALVGP